MLDVEKHPVAKYSYYALGILTLVNFLNYIDRQILPAVAALIARDLNLTHTEIGAMEGALLLSFTIFAPVFGRIGDKRSRTRLMAIAAVIWSISTGLVAVADKSPFIPGGFSARLPFSDFSFSISGIALLLCSIRVLVGIGESCYSTITPSLIADYFPLHKRGTALGTFQAAIPMGFALGYVIGAVLAYWFGWRSAFLIVGVPGLITALLVWNLKEPIRGSQDEDAPTRHEDQKTGASLVARVASNEGWFAQAVSIVRTRDWFLSTAGYTALTFVLGAFSTWAAILLVEEKNMSESAAGIALGVVTLFGGAAGTFGGGWIADRFARRTEKSYFLICMISCISGIPPLILALASQKPEYFLPAIFVAVLLLFLNNAPFHAILINSVPSHVRATSIALNIVVIHTFGDVISRFGVGILSDSIKEGRFELLQWVGNILGLTPRTQHLTTALLVSPIVLIAAGVFFYLGTRGRSKYEAHARYPTLRPDETEPDPVRHSVEQ